MDLPKNVHDLSALHEPLFNALKKQLCKDFGDIELRFSTTTIPLTGILEELTIVIGVLLDGNTSKLMSVLYRIDVSEPNLKAALLRESVTNPAQVIAEMVLEREYQKVYFRALYSTEN